MAKKIVLVIDEAEVLDMMQVVVEGHGYESVRCRPSQSDCQQEIVRVEPDIILLDIPLGRPAITDKALSLVDALKADPATSHTPIVVCATLEQKVRARMPHLATLGCDIVSKPFEMSYLLNVIDRSTQQKKAA